MIPKVIHYCWFGRKPLPDLAVKCITSWKRFLPDYEIKEWNEDNFDVNAIPYTAEAYMEKKYAFVSDYARFWILYKYGGLYFDTDVEIIRPMDDVIAKGSFMGCEKNGCVGTEIPLVAPGLGLGVTPQHHIYKELIDLYRSLHFKSENGELNQKTIVIYTTEILQEHGLSNTDQIQNVAGINIYPQEYFCPLHEENNRLGLFITNNTYTIHHWAASWQPKSYKLLARIKVFLMNIFGDSFILSVIDNLHLREIRRKIKM